MSKVLLLYDVPNWTWGRRCQDLQAHAPASCDVKIMAGSDAARQHGRNSSWHKQWDAVFDLNWTCGALDLTNAAKRGVGLVTCAGLLYDEASDADWDTWVVTGLRNAKAAAERLPQFNALIAVNRRLYAETLRYNTNTYLIPSPVNADFYTPGPPPQDRKLRVGWCASPRGHRSVKGYKEVLAPLMDSTSSKYDWVTNTRDYRDALTREQMVAWYHDIDVLICTSINEGTPSPIFESASCARAIISTNVGCVADWKLPHELDLITGTYRNQREAEQVIEATAARLEHFDRHRDTVALVGQQLRESVVQEYSYQVLAPRYYKAILG